MLKKSQINEYSDPSYICDHCPNNIKAPGFGIRFNCCMFMPNDCGQGPTIPWLVLRDVEVLNYANA
jgi:hypothetical protein